MRVVTLRELCGLPGGTVFSTSADGDVEGLYRRGKVLAQADPGSDYFDFFYEDLLARPVNARPGGDGGPFRLGTAARWGNFDPHERFVVYEPDDVARLVDLLSGRP